MRKNAWFQVATTCVAMLLLLLAGAVMLAHQAGHQGGDPDCPVCLQGHLHEPLLTWSYAAVAAPPRLTALLPQGPREFSSEPHGLSPTGRAPPPPLA